MLREYTKYDIPYIENIGKVIKDSYKLCLGEYDRCIVYVDKDVLGFVIYRSVMDEAELIDIAVKDGYHNKGIGSMLLDYVHNQLNSVNKITLEVRKSSKAVDFYKKHDYKEISIRKNYYENDDAIIMQRVM